MLYDQDMPRYQCVEACITVVYILNMVPQKALGKTIPEEAFTIKKLDVNHKIFDYMAYFHIPGEHVPN